MVCGAIARAMGDGRSSWDGPSTRSDALPDDVEEIRLPKSSQVAAALAAAALVGPAALGGMPVLPVTVDDERRRQMDEIAQESTSTVGIHRESSEAEAALALSQRQLAAVTREVEGSTSRVVSEADVVHAADLVARGEVSARRQREFRSALRRVAANSTDLFMLWSDEQVEDDGLADMGE